MKQRLFLSAVIFLLAASPAWADGPSKFSELAKVYDFEISKCLESQTLNNNAKVEIESVLLESGRLLILKVQTSYVHTDGFYCEQALWDAAPFVLPHSLRAVRSFTKSSGKSRFDSSKIFFETHPELKDSVEVVHIIPLSVLRLFPGMFTENELHGLKNLAAVAINSPGEQNLANYHAQVTDFLANQKCKIQVPISRNEIIDQVNDLLHAYSTCFSQLPNALVDRETGKTSR